jgi:N6-adenosine-specific RNA methylase IME4
MANSGLVAKADDEARWQRMTPASLALPGFILSSAGLQPNGQPTYEQWEAAGRALRSIEGSVHWWIGDWLNYGENVYGEKYKAAIETTGFDYQTLADDKWVAAKIEFSRRREILSFSHHKEVASLPPSDQDTLLACAERDHWNREQLRKQIRLHKYKHDTLPKPLSDGCTVADLQKAIAKGIKFRTIYADPPWPYDNQATRAATDNHYQTMPLEAIAALPIKDLLAPDAHLHIWTTGSFLPHTFPILEAWGFEYKTYFVWCKPQIGLGNYWRKASELMLLAVRGSAEFRDNSLSDWVILDRSEHSAKPEQIRHRIERVSHGPYLELFGRRAVPGWAVWGNEVSRDLFTEGLEEL